MNWFKRKLQSSALPTAKLGVSLLRRHPNASDLVVYNLDKEECSLVKVSMVDKSGKNYQFNLSRLMPFEARLLPFRCLGEFNSPLCDVVDRVQLGTDTLQLTYVMNKDLRFVVS